jgi:hypothetical protein
VKANEIPRAEQASSPTENPASGSSAEDRGPGISESI